MKKNILILLSLITFTAMAQTKGKFEVLDLKDFKLHVYYTNDALNDASVEGKNGLITLEQPLFKDNDTGCGKVGGSSFVEVKLYIIPRLFAAKFNFFCFSGR